MKCYVKKTAVHDNEIKCYVEKKLIKYNQMLHKCICLANLVMGIVYLILF